VVSATGFRPDHSFATELRLDLDPILGCTRTLADLIDPNEHSCGSVAPHGYKELGQPEPNYYAVGMKSYGRAPTFLMATGYEQVRSIAAALAGDTEAAARVELDLPSTGVCSTDLGDRETDESAEASGCGTGGVGFATGSAHGHSGEEPVASCCGSAPQTATTSSRSCG
jgi:hypothetical protein